MGHGLHVPRRRFLHLMAAAAALPATTRMASAQTYPARPVQIIVGFSPGGPVDISARLIAQWLSERLGQQFIVDNRPGAGGTLATESVARAAPDGYTLLMANGSDAVNATLMEKLSFVFLRDIAPVASVNRTPHVLEVHPSFPVKTVPELIAYAKANPGKLSVGTPPIGTGPYMAAALLKLMAGIDIVIVTYRGAGPMVTDILGGHVPVAFDGVSSSLGHIKTGRLRALAVTTEKRLETLPDIPAMAEFLPGYEEVSWCGVAAPMNTPAAIVSKINTEINAALADPRIQAQLAQLGMIALAGSPTEFGKLIADETEKWGNVIRATNIKPE